MKLKTNLFPWLAQSVLCIGIATNLGAQQDFNHFTTLKAAGTMPADFSTSTAEKIKNDIGTRTQLSERNEKVFLQGIHYSIDELLHSGLVIYGDEISTYVTKIADNLLKNEPELRSKLRFYTLKSNATNAFSTDQGIVFVTTGLISQLTSESQLAYVLAHEISHYTEKHVVETFDYTHNNKMYHDRISRLSTYSKEKEFEADKLGIKLYQEAGYSKNDLIGCFDVLLYSYLPFEDVEVPANYFNSDLMFVPAKYFPKEKYPIKAEEDQNDAQSTHPNIKKRKTAAEKEIMNFANWGSQRFIYGEQEFSYIRNLSRFESVRTDIIDAKYVDALYSILILEQSFPSSEYLARMKAHAWLGFAQLVGQNESSKAIQRSGSFEGEIAAMHYLFGKVNKSAISVMAMRYVTDIKNKYPENEEIAIIWKKMVKTLARDDKFSLSKFSSKNFHQAAEEFIQLKKDTVAEVEKPAEESTSKYDKIKKKKDVNRAENFDSTKYDLYMLSDLVSDSSNQFKVLYSEYKAEFEAENKKNDSINSLSKRERKRYWREQSTSRFNKGINDLIVIQPTAVIVKGKTTNAEKSQKAEEKMIESVAEVSEMLDMNVKVINTTAEFVTTTDEFNYRSRIFSYIEQKASNNHDDLFPVDFEDLDVIKAKYNTSNIAFMHYTHDFQVKGGWFITIMVGFFPALVTYPMTIMHGFKGEFSFVVVDISNGEVVLARKENINEANTASAVKSRIYLFMKDLKKIPQTALKQ